MISSHFIRQKVYKIKHNIIMSSNIPQSLVDWVQQLDLQSQFTPQQIESGRIIGKIMKSVVPEYNLQLLASNSAVNRVSNWNNLITQLKKVGIRVSQDQKNKIINGNHDVVYQILARLHDYYTKNQKQTEVDISKINPKSQISDSSSLLQLFILTIMKYFNLSSKQSVALLSSQCKYLAHIIVKGLKGEYKPIQGFLNQLSKHIQLIISFCKNRQNQLFFIRAIKPSLISKSDVTAEKGLNLLSSFLTALPNKAQIVKQYFISTLILAIRRHHHLMYEISKFSLNNTNFSKDVLVMFKGEASEAEIQAMFINIFNICKQLGKLEEFFTFKGVKQVMDRAIQNLKQSENTISSMDLVIVISSENTDVISDPERGSRFVQNIQEVVLSKKSDSITFVQQLFCLLQVFGKDKNQLAPALFKIIVSRYQSCLSVEQSRVYVQNFKQIIQEFPTIPVSFIIEAINSRVEANTLPISQVQVQFFREAIKSDSLDIKNGLMIYNIVSKFLVEEPAFANLSTDLILSITRKFSTQSIVFDLSTKLIKVCLAMHFANVKRLSQKRRSVTGNAKLDPEDAAHKSKNLALQQFIYRVVEEGFPDLNKSLQPLVCYSLIQVQHVGKQQADGLRRIIALFGDPAQIIKKYEAEAKKLQEEQLKKQDKKSKLKQSAWGAASGIKNRYDQVQNRERGISHITSSDEALKNIKAKSKLDPMSLSNVGVTPAAMRGLQKYQKTYIHKIQKIQQSQAKKKQQEDRQNELKKIFQRKMLDKGIEVKKINDHQFKYIYEFGVKEKQILMDTAKNPVEIPFYHADHEEQRDVKGLQYQIKKYQKILKLYYNIYSGHSKPQSLDSFDQIAQKVNLLYSASLWKLLKDHSLDQFITVREAQYIAKKINHNLDKKFDDSTALDFEGFQSFIVQASLFMFTRPPIDLRGHPISEMIEETISRFKLYASENKINQKLFDDPDNTFYNETQAVKQLNRKLQNNPDYILPEGYKKISQKKVIYTHRIFLDAMSSSYKDVYEIIDEMLHSSLGVHIIQPFTTYQTIAKARPTLYYKQRPEGDINAEKLSGFLKRQVAKMPIKDREVGKQVAGVLDELIQAVQFGHDKLGQKYQNKLIKQKKYMQEQQTKKFQQQKRKWENRNRQIKSALVKHKQVVETKQAEQERKKQEQKKKQEQDKKKREQQEQRLKKKVENYQNKKKEDQERRKKQEAQQKRKEKEDMERKKKQAEQIKRKIQETKKKKQQQQNEKKKLQEMAQKQRKIQQKKKMEQEQKKKKEMIEQYKNKKLEGVNRSQITQSPSIANRSEVKALDSKIGSSIQRKKLV